jgi:hypothetical protein
MVYTVLRDLASQQRILVAPVDITLQWLHLCFFI